MAESHFPLFVVCKSLKEKINMNVVKRIEQFLARLSSDRYIKYLRKKGIEIGEGTIVHDPKTVTIDTTRPELLSIGENVLLHKGITILTHDYASRVFVNLWGIFIPSHAKVSIGNNVWFGQNCTVLKGVTIGDNCIIGYGSTVMKDIPSNSVAAGTPAKVICSLEEYFNKRKSVYVEELKEYAYLKEMRLNRQLTAEDFDDDYPAFVDASNMDIYNMPYHRVFTNAEKMSKFKKNHKAFYKDFNAFIEDLHSSKLGDNS